jgi:hypothetical protein
MAVRANGSSQSHYSHIESKRGCKFRSVLLEAVVVDVLVAVRGSCCCRRPLLARSTGVSARKEKGKGVLGSHRLYSKTQSNN